MKKSKYYTSESVASGHPDKICDQISDAVLDEILRHDENGRVACETFITMGLIIIGGEITLRETGFINFSEIARSLLKEIGYTDPKYGLDYRSCAIVNIINKQSPEIAQGIATGGAGDQGIMIGYACDETKEFMPMPITLAHKLTKRMEEVRKKGILKYLGPDGKSQVTVEYLNGMPHRVSSVVLAIQHTEEILDAAQKITEKVRKEMIDAIAMPILSEYIDSNTKFYVNQAGKFTIGGPQSDTGMTGRKIMVDSYGCQVRVGGGAFSGKDPTKVDRSASYMARYIAKNIVAAQLAKKCLVELSYVIGKAEPLSVEVDTFGTNIVDESLLVRKIYEIFDLTPQGIIKELDLLKPMYLETATGGHFGRSEFTWEKTDKVKELNKNI